LCSARLGKICQKFFNHKQHEMKLKGKELIFISRILRDGSGVNDCSELDMSNYNEDSFEINCLSITEQTYIATEMNCFVVKIKNKDK